jgi:gluconokinase
MIIVLMGVSGSGKTVVGETLASRLKWMFEDADNWHPAANVEKMKSAIALTDSDREPWLRALNHAMRARIAGQHNVVLACSALRELHRALLREGIADPQAVRFVYLKGTYEVIDGRLRARAGHFMPESLLTSQFATLEEPDASDAFVVDVSQSVAAAVESIIHGLDLG